MILTGGEVLLFIVERLTINNVKIRLSEIGC